MAETVPRLPRKPALAAACLVSALGVGATAWACSCVSLEPQDNFAAASLVAEGRVVQVFRHPRLYCFLRRLLIDDDTECGARATVRLGRVWKGAAAERITVVTSLPDGACGVDFERGRSYLLFLDRSEAGGEEYSTSICAGTQPLEEASRHLDFLDSLARKEASSP